ncbi:MAG: glycosyltransferase family 39 protein [Anaerolineales bacterium]|nr:glycosyltransferase family 39 protein [Anaerolineales bacterium]
MERPLNVLVGLALILGGAFLFGKLTKQTPWAESNADALENGRKDFKAKELLPWLAVSLIVFTFVILQLAQHQSASILTWLWLGCLAILSALLWKVDRKNGINLDFNIAHRDGIWLFALLAFAFAAGCIFLNDLPAGWLPDEGPFWDTARQIALGKDKPSFFDFGVFTFPVASSMVQAWIMRWAGIDMWGWRFASVVPAALTVVPLYLLARDLFDRRVAVAASVFMIANPYFLSFARFGYNNSQSLLPVTACLYFLALGLKKDSRFYFWLAGLIAGFGFYTYFAAWLGLTVMVVTLLALPLISTMNFRAALPRLGLILVAAAAVILPRILYSASGDTPTLLHFKIWETGAVSGFYGNFVFGPERLSQARSIQITEQLNIYYDPTLYGIILTRGLVRSTAGLFDPLGYKEHNMIYGMAGPIASVFFALGLAFTLVHWMKFRFALLSIWFALGFIFLGVLSALPPRPTHFVAVIPAMALLAAVGLSAFLDLLMRATSARKKVIVQACLVFLIVSAGFFQYFFMVPFTYPASLDDYISWLGRQTAGPTNFYLVDYFALTRNPMDETLINLTPHKVTSLTSAEIAANPSQLEGWRNFVAVLVLKKDLADQLASQIPGASVQIAFAPFNTFRGYVVTDLPLNPAMDVNLWRGVQDLWNSPARVILLICIGGSLLILAIENKKQLSWLHSKIARRNQNEISK